jgi:DNA-binding NarL/FixJ family response regulator
VFIVGEVDNHPEAIDLSQTLTPDVIILDFEISGMKGIESKAIKTGTVASSGQHANQFQQRGVSYGLLRSRSRLLF